MSFKNGFVRTFAGFLAVVLLAGSADAHLMVFKPEKFSVPAGESVKAVAGLSEPLIAMVYSREKLLALGYAGNPGVANLSGALFFADGSKSVISSFTPVNIADPANTDPAKADANAVSFKIEKEGTVIGALRFDFNSKTRPTVTFGKTFINRTADGMATKRVGGKEALEIVLLDDVSSVKVDDTVKAQVFLRGQPLANATVSATYDGAPRHADSDEPDNNEYLHADTNADGKVSFIVDRAGTWVIGVEYVDETFDMKNPAYTENKGVRYRGTVLFPVSEEGK